MKPEDRLDIGFYAGATVALHIVQNNHALFDEIVRAFGKDKLIREARRRGVMRYSGLSDYLRRTKDARGETREEFERDRFGTAGPFLAKQEGKRGLSHPSTWMGSLSVAERPCERVAHRKGSK